MRKYNELPISFGITPEMSQIICEGLFDEDLNSKSQTKEIQKHIQMKMKNSK